MISLYTQKKVKQSYSQNENELKTIIYLLLKQSIVKVIMLFLFKIKKR